MIVAELDASRVNASLDARGEKAKAELRVGIGRLTLMLQRNVKRDKLKGQVLGNKSGRLDGSIQQAVLEEGQTTVGLVSTNVWYGVQWELGWPGRVDKDVGAAKAKFSLASADFFKNGTPKQRSFLRSALRDLEESGVIREELDAAAARAAA